MKGFILFVCLVIYAWFLELFLLILFSVVLRVVVGRPGLSSVGPRCADYRARLEGAEQSYGASGGLTDCNYQGKFYTRDTQLHLKPPIVQDTIQ